MIFYTGSYTREDTPAPSPKGKGICCFSLDEESGEVEYLHLTAQRNPSYLHVSADERFLYAVEEMFENLSPRVYAYRIEESGALQEINSQPLVGDYACHLAIVGNQLVIANYVSGNVLSYPVREDGGLNLYTQLIQHSGSGPNEERQEQAHAHMIQAVGKNEMYVVDLGIDKVKAYMLDETSNKWKSIPENDIEVEPGAGPRHMLVSEDRGSVYILSELSGKIFVFKEHKGRYIQAQELSIFPESYAGIVGGAALRMHPNGKYIYTSCRGSDVLAIFKIVNASGTLEFVEFVQLEGKTPRDFIVSPSGRWLIVAFQDSDELVVYGVDEKRGVLSIGSSYETGSPVNVCCTRQCADSTR